uniref:RNase III domain-containing protein n=1 Tax=viral metagenome TaxID=1070528 RepID=A0A6C0LRY2_9ZZZZ
MADAAVKIFNPWNLKNKDITTQDVESIMRRYGCPDFKVKKLHYFAQSCVHKSYVDRPEVWAEQEGGEHMVMAEKPEGCLALKKADNEELEFAGDSVLSAIVGKYLKMRYPGQGEGFLTSLRTQIVNNNNLGELAKKMGFAPYLILSRHVEDVCDGRQNLRILGSLLEAWIDAIMEHEGNEGAAYDMARRFVTAIMEKHVNFAKMIAEDKNYKDQLLRYFQAQFHTPPRYSEVNVEGPPHDRTFTMGVLDPQGKVVATSTARNKKVAEQEASRLALEIYMKQGTSSTSR